MRDPDATEKSEARQREVSLELGEPVPSPNLPAQSELQPELAQETPAEEEVPRAADEDITMIEHHAEDPSDPIESFSSAGDRGNLGAVDEDSIEDFEDDAAGRNATPPPRILRTPGTVSRMRDRHGRLSMALSHESTPRLAQKVLSDLPLAQEELSLSTHPAEAVIDPQLLEEDVAIQESQSIRAQSKAPEEVIETEEEGEDEREAEVEEQESEPEPEPEVRPRRMTRATRRASTVPLSSQPTAEPEAAPAPTTRRRGVRLTPAERAQREAEKVAERERKAAERKAAKEAKDAAKRAEKEAKAAAKAAAKEEKEKEKREKTPAARGGKRGARGRGAAAKPVSIRSRRADAEAEEDAKDDETVHGEGADEQEDDHAHEEQEQEPSSNAADVSKVSWTTLPHTQAESVGGSSMVDELQPSSPEPATAVKTKRGRGRPPKVTVPLVEDQPEPEPEIPEPADDTSDRADPPPLVTPQSKGGRKEPLFLPSSSQVPHTLYVPLGGSDESTPSNAKIGTTQRGKDVDGDHGSEGEDLSGANEGEQHRAYRSPVRPRMPRYSQSQTTFPTLTDIATQQLFALSQMSSPALRNQNSSFTLGPAQYEKAKENEEDDDDDDDSDSSDGDSSNSDSDAENGERRKSHIPQNRRAGAVVQKKRKSRLLSAYK